MSVATRRSIYGKLAGDTILNALLGTPATGFNKSIYYQQAAQGADFPYVIFNEMSETPRYAIGAKAYDNDVWQVKAVDRNTDADPIDTIKSRLDALLTDGTISISGAVQLYLRAESGVVYSETEDGVQYLHAGWLFRLMYD